MKQSPKMHLHMKLWKLPEKAEGTGMEHWYRML